ncbi:MAG: hypothetical protein ACP5D5_09355, partial [Acidithiobacillus sp.]|uniref:hypothetical protein n=1 Tax=Acidithiobacillus sp. TaxID=1872118 RepID=UPI003D04C238
NPATAWTQDPGAGANNTTPFAQYADIFSPALISGGQVAVPSPASLSAILSAGLAYVGTQRVPFAAFDFTVAASSTTYLDLTESGTVNLSTASSPTSPNLRLWEVVSAPIVSPTPTLSSSTSSGSLASGTYEYQLVAHDATGYGLPSSSASITTSATGEVILTWTNPNNETSMDIYGRVSGSIGLLASGVTGTTWTDTGSATVGAAPPTAATSNAIQTVTQIASNHPLTPAAIDGALGYTPLGAPGSEELTTIGLNTNQTLASGTHTTIQFNQLVTGNSANFDASAYAFVAPTAGVYLLYVSIFLTDATSGAPNMPSGSVGNVSIATQNHGSFQPFQAPSPASVTGVVVTPLDAGEQVTANVYQSGTSDTIQAGAQGVAGNFLQAVRLGN